MKFGCCDTLHGSDITLTHDLITELDPPPLLFEAVYAITEK